jgi:hypothetical protein
MTTEFRRPETFYKGQLLWTRVRPINEFEVHGTYGYCACTIDSFENNDLVTIIFLASDNTCWIVPKDSLVERVKK